MALNKALVLLIVCIASALASHSRFGSMSFTKNPSNPKEVTFTILVAYRTSYYFYSGNPVGIGKTFSDSCVTTGDGGYECPVFTVRSFNTQDDWLTGDATFTHTYANAGDYIVSYASCCRIFALNNNPSYSYAFTALVRLTQTEINSGVVNNSPVSGMLPIVEVPYNTVPTSFQLVAIDPENLPISYSMASAAQQGDPSSSHPPGLTVSSSGLVTLNQVIAKGYWTTQQVLTDSHGNQIVLDYIISVDDPKTYCNATCQNVQSPACTSNADCISCNSQCLTARPRIITQDLGYSSGARTNLPAPPHGSTYYIPPGVTTEFAFVADDENLYDPVTPVYIYSNSIPAGATLTTQVACDSNSGCQCVACNLKSQVVKFSWNPPNSERGKLSTLCIGVTSLQNPLPYSQHCVNLAVLDPPDTTGLITTGAPPSLTTGPFNVVAYCQGVTFSTPIGYFCSPDGSKYYQCMQGAWAAISATMLCSAGTTCQCPHGVECSYGNTVAPCT